MRLLFTCLILLSLLTGCLFVEEKEVMKPQGFINETNGNKSDNESLTTLDEIISDHRVELENGNYRLKKGERRYLYEKGKVIKLYYNKFDIYYDGVKRTGNLYSDPLVLVNKTEPNRAKRLSSVMDLIEEIPNETELEIVSKAGEEKNPVYQAVLSNYSDFDELTVLLEVEDEVIVEQTVIGVYENGTEINKRYIIDDNIPSYEFKDKVSSERRISRITYNIVAENGDNTYKSTGVGYNQKVLATSHGTKSAEKVIIDTEYGDIKAEVVGRDVFSDTAILDTNINMGDIEIFKGEIGENDDVKVYGYGDEDNLTIHGATVETTDELRYENNKLQNYPRIGAKKEKIEEGDSGGPVIKNGKLVGIVLTKSEELFFFTRPSIVENIVPVIERGESYTHRFPKFILTSSKVSFNGEVYNGLLVVESDYPDILGVRETNKDDQVTFVLSVDGNKFTSLGEFYDCVIREYGNTDKKEMRIKTFTGGDIDYKYVELS